MIPVARPVIGFAERRAVDRVLRSGGLAQGPEVARFEEEFSKELVDGTPVVAVNSGTSGQHLGLLAMGVGPGDEVIVPSFTFAATANAVALTGAAPVFCDIDPLSYTLDTDHLKSLVGPKTRGVMPVHLFGHPARMVEIQKISQEQGLEIYEDAAQAHGASVGGRKVGTFGDFAMFSLYPTKNMTSGEGGMVSCRTEETARAVRLLRNQGMETQYHNEIIGYNNRMTDIHAAIGRVQLRNLSRWTQTRIKNAQYLSGGIQGVSTPHVVDDVVHVFHQYTIRVPRDRDGFSRALKEEFGIGNGVYYPVPNHQLPSLKKYAAASDLPETVRAAKEVLSLPVHPSLKRRHLDRIVDAVNSLSKAGG
jgi:dTDP-4-amino-4,6-dideoxygalactose transaminase